MADICSKCNFYHAIDETTGKCKHSCAKRVVKPTDGCITEIVNGWPIVNGNEECCADAE